MANIILCLSQNDLNIVCICSFYEWIWVAPRNQNEKQYHVENDTHALAHTNWPIGKHMNRIFLDWITTNSKRMYWITRDNVQRNAGQQLNSCLRKHQLRYQLKCAKYTLLLPCSGIVSKWARCLTANIVKRKKKLKVESTRLSVCSRCLALHIQMRLSNIVVSFYLTGILIAFALILSNSNLYVNARKVSRFVCLRYVSIGSLCAIVHCIGARYSIATILHINGHCIRHMLILSLNLFHANHRKIVWIVNASNARNQFNFDKWFYSTNKRIY